MCAKWMRNFPVLSHNKKYITRVVIITSNINTIDCRINGYSKLYIFCIYTSFVLLFMKKLFVFGFQAEKLLILQ